MNELTSKINEILGSEEGMAQIKNLADSLGLTLPPVPDDNNQAKQNIGNQKANNSDKIPFDQDMIAGLQKAMNVGNDPDTALLLALKGRLSPLRQKKVDDAVKIMQLVKILPMIKEIGLFGGDKK